MKNALKCIVISLLFSSMAGAQTPKNDLDSFKKALEQFRAAKYDEAIPGFEGVLKDKTNLEEYARFYLAQSFMKTNKLDQAETELKKNSGFVSECEDDH
ncbi:hypothetical protein [Bdellovibrio bacteriovorus]|uniref:hypothetical protein n=1 Tax=Bdellovibrio bacteriovorus TaxID=959 RepID=UPI0035A9A197